MYYDDGPYGPHTTFRERVWFLVGAFVLALFLSWAIADGDMKLCKWNEHGYVRDGYQDGRYVGRCDDFGRLVR